MFERVKEIIEEQLNLDGVEVTEASRFKEDLQADSLDLFEMVMALEETYGIEIPTDDLGQLVAQMVVQAESHTEIPSVVALHDSVGVTEIGVGPVFQFLSP